jgi:hypothetical protein
MDPDPAAKRAPRHERRTDAPPDRLNRLVRSDPCRQLREQLSEGAVQGVLFDADPQ